MRSVLVACAFLLFALPVAAQGGDTARARQLFESGLAAARAQHWVEARDAFAESLAIAERPSTLLNLAGAQIQTGQLIEGTASYRRFLELATSGRDATHRGEAESALRAVEPRIPHVTLSVDGLSAGDEVRLDDHVVMPAALGTSIALDPGAHDVVVQREGRSISSQRFQLAESADSEIALSVTPVALAPAEVASTETAPMDQAIAMPVDDGAHDDSGIWIGVGIGVGAAVVIGVVVAVVLATQDPGAAPPYQGNLGAGVVRF